MVVIKSCYLYNRNPYTWDYGLYLEVDSDVPAASWLAERQLIKCRVDSWPDLTHWGRVMHICVGKLTIIVSDNGLWPKWCQAIIWTNAGILLIGPLGTNFSEILINTSLNKIRLKMSSAKCCSFRLSLNVLESRAEQSVLKNIISHIYASGRTVIHQWLAYMLLNEI